MVISEHAMRRPGTTWDGHIKHQGVFINTFIDEPHWFHRCFYYNLVVKALPELTNQQLSMWSNQIETYALSTKTLHDLAK